MIRGQRVPGATAGTLLSLPMAGTALAQQGGAQSAGSGAFAGLLQVAVALAVVLALIAVFAWLMRRMTQGRQFGGGVLKVRGGVMLGPKERAVLLEVADTWIVVGVGGGQVNALHAMPRPAQVDAGGEAESEAKPFGAWLQRALRERSSVSK